MQYPAIEPKRLSGTEPILTEKGQVVSDLNGFWSWAYSNVIDAAQSSKQTHFLNISFWKDRIIPAFPDRNPLFHLVCNHQAMNEDVQCYNDLCTQSNKGVNHSDYEMIYD